MNRSKQSQNEKSTIITEAIGLLAEQAQRTLCQELKKAQSSPNPPFFLQLRSTSEYDIDEEYKKDLVELQNFAEVLAETMAQLLKRTERRLLRKLNQSQVVTGDRRKGDKYSDQIQREDEVRNFTKIFAETRANLVDEVKSLVKELRKDSNGESDDGCSPRRSENIFSTLGIDPQLDEVSVKNNKKRPISYGSERDFVKNTRTSPSKMKSSAPQDDDVCYVCDKKGHWAYQCTKPDNRSCYICNKKGHISTQCSLPENRSCYHCGKEGHLVSDCEKLPSTSTSKPAKRKRRSKSYSRERSYSRESSR